MNENRPFNVWPNMVVALTPDLAYVVKFAETWVWKCKRGRRPSNRPVKVWPDGRCRVEFGATFSSFKQAADRIRADMAAWIDSQDGDVESERAE